MLVECTRTLSVTGRMPETAGLISYAQTMVKLIELSIINYCSLSQVHNATSSLW